MCNVCIYGCTCQLVRACFMCVFVCNLISASGPMALVCLHPKSKLCNYDDRPVLFISHRCLSLPLSLSALMPSPLSVFIFPLVWPVCLWKGSQSLNSYKITPSSITSSFNAKSSRSFSVCVVRSTSQIASKKIAHLYIYMAIVHVY